MKHRTQIPLRHFFATPPTPCPYIAGRLERKVVTLLTGSNPNALHEALSLAGFRRSQDLAYRPACDNCTACVPVRIPVRDLAMSRSQRRIVNRHRDIVARSCVPEATREHFLLFRRYIVGRHSDGGMADMDFSDYRAMVEETPVDTELTEFREPDGSLYAVCLVDRMSDGFSLVYSFFDPTSDRASPGNFVILWHVMEALRLGLPHVYLGYWIAESRKMAYKRRFAPLEALGAEGWYRLESDEAPAGDDPTGLPDAAE
ncbi:arginyltransferase [Marinibaculum pumilum]|uniref:Aspartate/glutamate leucyltransferase n=1 Tax=Marinibaculum pumilum TaxID=1766165 RepID=A0ABV7KWR8_9PROT